MAIGNEIFGIGFALLAIALTFLMYYLWGFPYDKQRNRSGAPASLVLVHRLFGYVFVAVYIYLMWEMVPRLWTYQVELPARTVAHLLLGLTIGAILFIKIVIVRFFKHMEPALAPILGTSLLVCTLLLLGLALPTTLRESYLRQSALMGGNMNEERLARVREQLPKAGIDDPALLAKLATEKGLLSGRSVLIRKCVQCHDLRTILARPKTPDAWRQTVMRMANQSSVLDLIDEDEQLRVTAYLVAITPTLQQTARLRRQEDMKAAGAQAALGSAQRTMDEMPDMAASIDLAAAEATFQTRCSQCHSPLLVQSAPPRTEAAAGALVARMVRNGLRGSEQEFAQIIGYLTATFAAPPASPAKASPPPVEDPVAGADATGGVPESSPVTAAKAAGGPVDREIVLRPAGTELSFETTEVEAKTGTRVRLVLDNPAASGLTHNVVLVRDADAYDEISSAALGAPAAGFVPEHEAIIAGIPAQSSGSTGMVDFVAPAPGRYRYGCMMPGHSFTMFGTLIVTD